MFKEVFSKRILAVRKAVFALFVSLSTALEAVIVFGDDFDGLVTARGLSEFGFSQTANRLPEGEYGEVNRITFWGGYLQVVPPSGDSFRFRFFSSSSSVEPYLEILPSNLVRFDTGLGEVGGPPIFEYQALIPQGSLSGVTEGVFSILNQTETGHAWAWQGGVAPGTGFIRSAESVPWGTLRGVNPAFRFEVIPEPSTVFLSGVLPLFLLFTRRRQSLLRKRSTEHHSRDARG